MEIADAIEAKEAKLDALAQELYTMGQFTITPIYPWVIVRIMPKAQKFGTLYLPEKQNKIFYEGIVLATWRPFWREFRGKMHVDGILEGSVVEKQIQVSSQVKRGDRVMFMHFEGQPVPWLDEKNYRMIHEVETHPNGGIWGTLETEQDRGLKEKLDELFKDHTCVTISGS